VSPASAFSMWRRGPHVRGGIHKRERPSKSQPARQCGSTQARPSKMPSIRRLRRHPPGRRLHHQRDLRHGSKRPLDVREHRDRGRWCRYHRLVPGSLRTPCGAMALHRPASEAAAGCLGELELCSTSPGTPMTTASWCRSVPVAQTAFNAARFGYRSITMSPGEEPQFSVSRRILAEMMKSEGQQARLDRLGQLIFGHRHRDGPFLSTNSKRSLATDFAESDGWRGDQRSLRVSPLTGGVEFITYRWSRCGLADDASGKQVCRWYARSL
jgi:hypothetical protein